MNNLEKYVLALTKEDYINLISERVDCHTCPAFDLCNKNGGTEAWNCTDTIREWASMEEPQDEEGTV